MTKLERLKAIRFHLIHLSNMAEKTLSELPDGTAEKRELNAAYTRIMHSLILVEKKIKDVEVSS